MTLRFDFELIPQSQESAQNSYNFHWGRIEQFCLDTDMTLHEVLSLPEWMLTDFYQSEAWNLKKEDKGKRDQIDRNYVQLLQNVNTNLQNLQKMRAR